MGDQLRLHYLDLSVREESELWWRRFAEYMDEISDETYFHEPEYRNAILELNQRRTNPLFAVLLERDGQTLGLCSYVIYHDENEKCFILEFGIAKPERRRGMGSCFYEMIETDIVLKNGAYIDLTAGGEAAEAFWTGLRFDKTEEIAENGTHIMRKRLSRDLS